MGRLYNTLDNIERGRRACIDNLNAQGITTRPDTSIDGIANQIKTGVAGEGVFIKEAFNYNDIRKWIVNIPQLDTSKVTSMSNMFSNCRSLTSVPQLDTSQVTNMSNMFASCRSLKTIPQLDTSNVTSMNDMFNYCDSLETIPPLDTSQVINISYMFYHCEILTKTPPLNVGKATNMYGMFDGCKVIKEIDISLAPILPNCSMTRAFNFVPKDCLIKVYDEASKQMVLKSASYLTNIVVVNK